MPIKITPQPDDEDAFRQFVEDVTLIGDDETLPRLLNCMTTEALVLAWRFYEDLLTDCGEEPPDSPNYFSPWDHEVRYAIHQELRNHRGITPLPADLLEDDLDAPRH